MPISTPLDRSGMSPDLYARGQAEIGDRLFGAEHFEEACRFYGEAVRNCPEHAGYHYRLALAAWSAGKLELVERHLKEALRLGPLHPMTHEALSQWYLETARIEDALFHSGKAIELAPDNEQIIIARALVLESSGDYDQSWKLIEPLLAGCNSARLAGLYGRLAPRLKREHQALDLIIRLLNASQLPKAEQSLLQITAAHLLERMGRYDEAFEHARLANEGWRRPYDPQQATRLVDRLINYFTAPKMKALPRALNTSRRPVFIIGMPRSGTTLVEQILASHPMVYGAGEMEALGHAARGAEAIDAVEGLPYPACLDATSILDANKLAEQYLSQIPDASAPCVTDKANVNFLHRGLISLLFPRSRVIHCTRDPLDTCLSCYFTNFVSFGHEFTNDLSHLGQFYRDYRRLMEHWGGVLGLEMLDIKYEDVVEDLEGQTRRLLDYLELPWCEQCLRFYESKRQVATASSDQVRRPIYRASVGRWKHYARHLSVLRELLG